MLDTSTETAIPALARDGSFVDAKAVFGEKSLGHTFKRISIFTPNTSALFWLPGRL